MTDNNYQQGEYNSQNVVQNNSEPTEQKASVGLAILSFLFPIIGLIIFIVNKDKKPKTAKASGICALVSFILGIAFSLIATFGSIGILSFMSDDDIDFDDSSYEELLDGENDYELDLTEDDIISE